jgi:hypothetical protein
MILALQAAATIAALGLAHPPLLAKLMDDCLEAVERSGQQLSLLAAPYDKPGGAASTAAASQPMKQGEGHGL